MDIALTFVALAFVIFQTRSHIMTSSPSKVSMPENCKNMNFCIHKHEDYPDETIERLFEDSENMFDEYHQIISERDGEIDFSEDECQSVLRMVLIYEIEDLDGNIRFVVQSEKKFKQIIRLEQCTNPGPVTAPNHLSEEILNVVNLECYQCTMDYKFLVLSLEGKSLEAVSVKGGLPVCCSCRILE